MCWSNRSDKQFDRYVVDGVDVRVYIAGEVVRLRKLGEKKARCQRLLPGVSEMVSLTIAVCKRFKSNYPFKRLSALSRLLMR